ncbi:hypothetical protein TNCT_402141 [Trichonephila clavata]|uniref:Uncharacterized protein n=1 Tax=Trichonephila clavata TaxID=2740835 RepID=A0A8X6F2I2_TRICU|nr:hypothetical protein TNCT_402141 [Trichonephila clavata]
MAMIPRISQTQFLGSDPTICTVFLAVPGVKCLAPYYNHRVLENVTPLCIVRSPIEGDASAQKKTINLWCEHAQR